MIQAYSLKAPGPLLAYETAVPFCRRQDRSNQQIKQKICSGIGDEAVADAADGGEMAGLAGVVFDVATEADDEVIDGAGVSVFVNAPDLFEDLFAGDDLGGAVGEIAKEIGLHEGELGGAVGGEQFEGVKANGAAGEGDLVGGLGRRGGGSGRALPGHAAKQAFKADEEDVEVEGLGEVIVGTGLDAFEDLFGAGARGEHKDGNETPVLAEGAGDDEAVGTGKHAVQKDGSGGVGAVLWDSKQMGEGKVSVGEVLCPVALGLKVEEQTLGEVGFVFDEDDEREGDGHAVSGTIMERRVWRGEG